MQVCPYLSGVGMKRVGDTLKAIGVATMPGSTVWKMTPESLYHTFTQKKFIKYFSVDVLSLYYIEHFYR